MIQEWVGGRQLGTFELASSVVQSGVVGERATGAPPPVPAHIWREADPPDTSAIPKCFNRPSLTIQPEFDGDLNVLYWVGIVMRPFEADFVARVYSDRNHPAMLSGWRTQDYEILTSFSQRALRTFSGSPNVNGWTLSTDRVV